MRPYYPSRDGAPASVIVGCRPDAASEVPIERVGAVTPHIVLTVRVSGEPVRALFDSGASTSVLDRSEASRLGVVVETPGDAAGKAVGVGPATVDWWVGQVQSVMANGVGLRDALKATGKGSGRRR